MDTYGLSDAFIELLPDDLDDQIRPSSDPGWGNLPTFSDKAVQTIADEFQAFIASTIAKLIDAGSEREAIMEDEELNEALKKVLRSW